jgi:RNA recognition motif-containing protein
LVKDLTLFTKFQKFGDIKGVSVLCDKMTKVSKEIGFVQFSRAEQVETCIAQMNFRNYMGRELYLINKDKFQEVLKKQTTYIVTNLPQNLTNADFRKHLESFGEVVVSELYYTKAQNQMVVDYGKVSFMTEEAGQKFL